MMQFATDLFNTFARDAEQCAVAHRAGAANELAAAFNRARSKAPRLGRIS